MKIDPWKSTERWQSWKEKVKSGIVPEMSKTNSAIYLDYLFDMEKGLNVSNGSVKGSRSHIRLINLKSKFFLLISWAEKRYHALDITKLTEEQIMDLFLAMRDGEIKTKQNKKYRCVRDFAKVFKAFWHWHMKVSKKKGIEVIDITEDLDTSGEKPDWVYLTEEQIKELCEKSVYKYKVLFMFLFDTGIRSPTELVNVKVSDLSLDCKELMIREETSKTFGRRIKLLLCSNLLKEYIKTKKLSQDDYLFPICSHVVNRYLKRLGKKLFGDRESPAGQKYSELSMYDFRHCACCYWLPRYKSESALKYRFGWKSSDKIHYYSELLGMRDTISEEDLLIDVTKTEIEQKLAKSEKEKEVMQERLSRVEEELKILFEKLNVTSVKAEMIRIIR